MQIALALMVLPLLFSLSAFISSVKVRQFGVISAVVVLMLLSLFHFNSFVQNEVMILEHIWHYIFISIDILLLLFFLYSGIKKSNKLVSIFAVVQMLLYGVVLFLPSSLYSHDILVDYTSSVMFLVVNIVGGLIIIYALEYIKSESFHLLKKNTFIALLFLFLAVMNFIVSTNNIEIFFMLFELTTLFSYLLIGYRSDTISQENALRALWINQIGGVAILTALVSAILYYNTLYFDILLSNIDVAFLLPLVLLAIAAFVKAASVPFEKWLLGAMVAPTPVSAILHSATMVKIAPFLILKLSDGMNDFMALMVALFGSFVFFSASLLALSRDYFKEILALSTIALLALMISLASLGTPVAKDAALMLIVFHAISKALLFLQAGILEKSLHLKYVKDIDGLVNYSPLVTFFIVIGFASLTLPPFGAFIGKFEAIIEVASKIEATPFYSFVLLFITLGSVFLTLLYFKVVTKLFAKDVDSSQESKVPLSKLYTIPSYILVLLLVLGFYLSYSSEFLNILEVVTPLLILLVVPILFSKMIFKKATRVKEYHCGEKDDVMLNMYYFHLPKRLESLFYFVAISIIVILLIGVL